MSAKPTIDRNAVYWLEDPDRRMLPQIAGEVEYLEDRRELRYKDTERPHLKSMQLKGGELSSGLEFEGEDGSKAILRKLDLKTFEKLFRAQVHKAPQFKSEAELQSFYRELVRAGAY